MKRQALLFIFSFLLNSAQAAAQSSLTYQRKTQNPDFFIPQGTLQRQEKLPPIHSSEPQNAVEQKSISRQETTKIEFKGLSNTPAYKEKYNAYLNSIKDIAQTGQAYQDSDLENDLSKMNSNQPIGIQ